jgi:hypothetical protein
MKIPIHKILAIFGLALLATLLVPQHALAQDDDDDPPSRVARLSYTHGSVSFNPAGTDDWVTAVVNRPITTGDKLWSDSDSRAELHLGSAAIRLSATTGMSFLNLTDAIAQIRLTEGTINIRLRQLENNEIFEVDTPNLAFNLLRPGRYSIQVNENGDVTAITVDEGEGEVTGGGNAYTIHPHESGSFAGSDQLDADIQQSVDDRDDFDRWCRDRERREEHSVSSRYVSSDVIGYEDLDDNGGWREDSEYGHVWYPHVTIVGWAPYRYGHWVWIAPWGWTWVDDAPWGFAPFHYGRWVFVRGYWGWVPCPPRPMIGVAYVRPVYAPALVAWVGGPHFAVGIGIGGGGGVSVGWFPLGPREVYMPSYHVSRAYVTNVNISNTTVNNTVVNNYYNTTIVNKNVNVTNVTYVNQRVPGAVTATNTQTFTSAQPVARNLVRVNQREVNEAPVAMGAPTGAPSRQSVLGAGTPTSVRPPSQVLSRPVVAKTAPPPVPVAFARQQQAVQANGGRPVGTTELHRMQPQDAQRPQPNFRMANEARQNPPQQQQPNRPPAGQQNQNAQGAAGNARQDHPNPMRPMPTNPPANRNENNRPPTARQPNPPQADPQLEQRHQQELQQLHQRQDQERQKVEQQQEQQRQKLAQKNADDRRQQESQQRQQQQLQQVERKHDQEQQRLQDKQRQEEQRQRQQPANAPKPKEVKPPKPKDDKPQKPR